MHYVASCVVSVCRSAVRNEDGERGAETSKDDERGAEMSKYDEWETGTISERISERIAVSS